MPSDPAEIASRIRDNLERVRENIAAAVVRAGRTHGPRLVGVTKYVEPTIARLLVEAGLDELGESRPQELWKKTDALADMRVTWHLIGHLQRNKVKRTLPLVGCIDSADSLRLLQEISNEAVAQNLIADVLLEVNVSGDVSKHGFQPGDIEPLFPDIAKLPRLCVLGLMTMASIEGGLDRARRDFAALRALRDQLERRCPKNVVMNELSMGMSGDYEVAVEEGATIVRVGSALFEGV